MKRLLAALAALPLLLSLFACQGGPKPLDLSYETPDGKKVAVRQVEPSAEAPHVYYNWWNPGEEKLYDIMDFVAKGTAVNVREIEISYGSPDEDEKIRYATVFDFLPAEVYRSDRESPGKITVYCGRASYNFPIQDSIDSYYFTRISEKGSYYLCLQSLENDGINTLGQRNFADYYLISPQAFLVSEDFSGELLRMKLEFYESEKNNNQIVGKYSPMSSLSFDDFGRFLEEYYQ